MPRRTSGHRVLTADQAIGDALGQAKALVERISGLLADRAADLAGTRIDWGHVGSVAEVNRRLAAVADFLADPT